MDIYLQSGVSTYVGNLAQYSGSTMRITNSGDSIVYDVNYCGAFAAYYLGSNGGWNAFLFEGNCHKTDKIERHSINKSYLNTSIDFGEKPYISEIVPEYELNTGWLSDRQAALFAKELMGSNKIYLHDLAEDRIFPAVIVDDEAQYKKFADEHKPINYTLKVKESQTRIRR